MNGSLPNRVENVATDQRGLAVSGSMKFRHATEAVVAFSDFTFFTELIAIMCSAGNSFCTHSGSCRISRATRSCVSEVLLPRSWIPRNTVSM